MIEFLKPMGNPLMPDLSDPAVVAQCRAEALERIKDEDTRRRQRRLHAAWPNGLPWYLRWMQ